MDLELFAQVTKSKDRFPHKRGTLTIEDVWDLGDDDLNYVYKTLKAELGDDDNLGGESTKEDATVRRKIAAVKAIYDYKQAQKEAAVQHAAIEQRKRLLMDALAKKKNEKLESMTAEEIEAELKELVGP